MSIRVVIAKGCEPACSATPPPAFSNSTARSSKPKAACAGVAAASSARQATREVSRRLAILYSPPRCALQLLARAERLLAFFAALFACLRSDLALAPFALRAWFRSLADSVRRLAALASSFSQGEKSGLPLSPGSIGTGACPGLSGSLGGGQPLGSVQPTGGAKPPFTRAS